MAHKAGHSDLDDELGVEPLDSRLQPDYGNDDKEPPRPPTPIGFDPDTGAALFAGDSGVQPYLERTHFSESGMGPPVYSTRRKLYYDEYLDDLTSRLSPERTRELQQAFVYLGMLSEKSVVTYGRWDDSSRGALKELLAISNRSGRVWDQTLEDLLRTPNPALLAAPRGPSGPSRAPFQPRTPDRDEVKRVYQQAAIRSLGGQFNVSDDEMEAFADSFTEQVVSAQRAAYDGRPISEPPSATAEAQEQLEDTRGDEVEAADFAGYVDVLRELIG